VRAIIIAAGHGTRLRPHTDDRPKCLVDLGGTTILEHQLGNCVKAGIEEVVVIAGYEWRMVDDVVSRFAATATGTTFRIVYNPFFSSSNNLISLWSARHFMDAEMITINGDDVFTHRILSRLMAQTGSEIYVSMDEKPAYDEDDMKMIVDDAGRVRRVNKTIAASESNGESIGIMRFTKAGAARLMDELETMVRTDTGLSDWYTLAIERIAVSGFPVGAVSIHGLPWAEVDFPADLEAVRQNLARYLD
jgi:L-glutamine-phosphate cytidylyltransferase